MTRNIYNDATRQPEQKVFTSQGYDHTRFSNSHVYSEMVQMAANYFGQMRDLQMKFIRDTDYYMGRQLNDTIVYNGRPITVHDYMEMKGMAPLSSDIISDKMITLKGLVRQQYMAPKVKSVDAQEGDYALIFSELLRQNDNNNEKAELAADLFQTHICWGFPAAKVKWTFRNGREDVYIDEVDMMKVAIPPFHRKDLEDVEFIAEAQNLTWPRIVQLFARKPGDEEILRNIFNAAKGSDYIQGYNDTGMNHTDRIYDFYHSDVLGKYRVIEIWRKEYNKALWCHDRLNATAGFRPLADKEAIDAENNQRRLDNVRRDENGVPLLDADGRMTYYIPESELELIEYEERIEDVWYYRFLSPNGYLLSEGVSPYRVVRDGYSFTYHPYVFMAYGMRGEVRSFEDRIIDKQRQYNHNNILLEFILMNSAKGPLAIDEEALSEEMSLEDIMDQWVKVDGYILYTSKKGGQMPQQIINKSIPAGLEFLIQRDRDLVQTQSNVQPALQGATPAAGTSYKRYAAEQQSSATGVADYVASFNNFLCRIAKKQLWTMQAFYTSRRSVQVTGEDFWRIYDPDTMGDIDCDLAMTLDANSAVIREQLQELAFQAYQKDEISFTQMLDAADFGDTARMKRFALEHKQEKMMMAQQQAAAGMAPTGQAPGLQQRDNGAARLNTSEASSVPSVVGSPGSSA